ncbi:MAG: TolC family protein [Nitrospirae bacterium]|nr:TolC family protein [Nitrospirota bacterium]
MIKRTLLFLVLLTAAVPVTLPAQEYSLSELYSIALEKSKSIKIAEEGLYLSERDKDRAAAVLTPALSAFGSSTEYSNSGSSLPDNSTAWGLKLGQSISMSGREVTALDIAKESIVKSRFDLDTVRGNYLLQVAASYYDVLKAKKALEIINANVERLTKHRDAAKVRLKVGESTKTVLLRAEAELSGAQSDLIRADNALKFAKVILARTVGISNDFGLKEDQPSAISTMTLDSLKQTALSERAELKSAGLQKEIADKQIKYTKGLYWPSLSVEGVYSRKEDDPSVSSSNSENIYGVLSINYPLFDGGLRKAEVSQAEARLRQADYRLQDLQDSVNVEVENAYLNLATVSGVLEKLRAEVEYARDNYNSVTKQFEFGLADSINVMDANTLLVTSERQLANAQYDQHLALLILQRATGTLLKAVAGK